MKSKTHFRFVKNPKMPEESAYLSVLKSVFVTADHPDVPVLLGYLRSRQYGKLLEWAELPITEVCGATQFYVETQLKSLIRKYPFSTSEIPGINPEGVARRKFHAAEHRMKRVNLRRRLLRYGKYRMDRYASYFDDARRYISRVIGETPDLSMMYDNCDFPAGASLGVHGNATNLGRKFLADSWSVTPTALNYAIPALWLNASLRDLVLPGPIRCYDYEEFSSIVRSKVQLVNYNKISFVPKTARTHRSIAIEPTLNGFLQKGVDLVLRKKLLQAGIDISDQSRNQVLAYKGSLGGHNPYVTVDLSAASDSLSVELCEDLLPPDWFSLLNCLRSPSYMDTDGTVKTYQKFCSMGNGFCFPLETLIFASLSYAASKACVSDPYDFSVYGDDIIVRQSAALILKELMGESGFQFNTEKTFVFGPFRESCGADWYAGQDVRPVTIDKRLSDLRSLMSLHNSCLRSPRVELFTEQARETLRRLGRNKYLRPGREPGDTGFSVPLDLAICSKDVIWNRDLQRWSWKELLPQPVCDKFPVESYDPLLVNWVEWCAVQRGASSSSPLTLRYTSRFKVRRIARQHDDRHANWQIIAKCTQVLDELLGAYLRRTQTLAKAAMP